MIGRRTAWTALICAAWLAGGPAALSSPAVNREPKLVRTLTGVGGLVGFLPGGNTVLTVSRDGTYSVRLWQTGKVSNEYALGGQVDESIFRSGRGYLLYRDRDLTTIDATTGQDLLTIRLPAGSFERLFWVSPNGKQAAVTVYGKPPVVYDLRSGRRVRELNDTRIVALSPDAKLAVVRDQKRIVLQSTDTGRPLAVIPVADANDPAIAFSADGTLLAVWAVTVAGNKNRDEYSSEVILLNTRTGKKVNPVMRRTDHVWLDPSHLMISADERWLIGGAVPDTAVIWDLSNARQVAMIRGHELGSYYSLSGVAFSPDGRFVAVGTFERDVLIYELPRAQSARPAARKSRRITRH